MALLRLGLTRRLGRQRQQFGPPGQDLELAALAAVRLEAHHTQRLPPVALGAQRQKQKLRNHGALCPAIGAQIQFRDRGPGKDLFQDFRQDRAGFAAEQAGQRQATRVNTSELGQSGPGDTDVRHPATDPVGQEDPVKRPIQPARIKRRARGKLAIRSQPLPVGAHLCRSVKDAGSPSSRARAKAFNKGRTHQCPQ